MKIYSSKHQAIVEAPIMEKPEKYHLTEFKENKAWQAYNKWLSTHIAVLPGREKEFVDGQEAVEGVHYRICKADFVSGNYQNKCTFCKKLFSYTDKLWFICPDCCNGVAIPIKQVSEEDKPSNIPDGENDWTIGSKTFTRDEVFKILYTQRAMILNDLKRYCWDEVAASVKDIVTNPRKPII